MAPVNVRHVAWQISSIVKTYFASDFASILEHLNIGTSALLAPA